MSVKNLRVFFIIVVTGLLPLVSLSQAGSSSVFRKTTVSGNLVENTLVQRNFFDSAGRLLRQQDYADGVLGYTTENSYHAGRLSSVTVSRERKELERTVYTYAKCPLPVTRNFYLKGKAVSLQRFVFGNNCLLLEMSEQELKGNDWNDSRREIRTYDGNDSLTRQVIIRGRTDTLLDVKYVRTDGEVIRTRRGTDRELLEEERTLYTDGRPAVRKYFENGELVSEEHFTYEDGLLKQRVVSSQTGLVQTESFAYDQQRRIVSRKQYDAGIRETEYEYRYGQ